jgi:hypothetical protein
MPKKSAILEELNFLTDQISTQIRTVALGVLVLTWGLLIGESQTIRSLGAAAKPQLLVTGGAAILTMFLDFLQYAAGYVNAKDVLARMERDHLDDAPYDYKSWSYRLRLFFFHAKCWLLSVTVMWFLFVLGWWLLNS